MGETPEGEELGMSFLEGYLSIILHYRASNFILSNLHH